MIRVFEPYISAKDVFSVAKSVLKKDISGSSNEVKIFEENLAKYFDRKYAVLFSIPSKQGILCFPTHCTESDVTRKFL